MYYTVVFPIEEEPYIKKCPQYVKISNMYDTTAGFYGISHPDYRLRALIDSTLDELLENPPRTIYIYGSDSDIHRDMYHGLDKKTAEYIRKQENTRNRN